MIICEKLARLLVKGMYFAKVNFRKLFNYMSCFQASKITTKYNIVNGKFHLNKTTKVLYKGLLCKQSIKKSRIRETKNLSTDAESRTDTILERLCDLSKKRKKKKKMGGLTRPFRDTPLF